MVSEELSYENHKELIEYCSKLEITFLSTPYDKDGLDFLCNELQIPAIKIASADLVNHRLLEQCAKKMKPIILSTGMSDINEVAEAVEVILSNGNMEIILLQCTGCYPTIISDVNLNVIKTYQEKFNCLVGYSDHCEGVNASLIAIDMGAQIILCDPHRATVIGLDRKISLKGIQMTSPDIRAGVSLLIAALSADGESIINNADQIDRGYSDIENRLKNIGAQIERI